MSDHYFATLNSILEVESGKEIMHTRKLCAHYVDTINHIANAILVTEDEASMMLYVCKSAISKLGFYKCTIYMLEEGRSKLVPKAYHSVDEETVSDLPSEEDWKKSIKIGDGPIGKAALLGKFQTIPADLLTTESPFKQVPQLIVPIMIQDAVVGVIVGNCSKQVAFVREQLNMLTVLCSMLSLKLTHFRSVAKYNDYQVDLEQFAQKRTQDLKKAMDELEESNKDFKDFTRIISHDFREPLRTIKSYLSIVERKYLDKIPEECQILINEAAKGAARMENLLVDLVQLTRLDKSEAVFEMVDMNKVLTSVLDSLSLRLAEVEVVLDCDNLPTIYGLESQIYVLFQNLLDNAIKFRSERKLIININCRQTADEWEFRVKDNGIGIPNDPKIQEYVFMPFHRLHPNRGYSGTGIGLALCKNIIKKHHGNIWINSKEGFGTTIHFTIPKI